MTSTKRIERSHTHTHADTDTHTHTQLSPSDEGPELQTDPAARCCSSLNR